MILNLVNDMKAIDAVPHDSDPFAGIEDADDREEIFYLALQLIQADKKITDHELEFCALLATKLGFRNEAVKEFAFSPLPPFNEFREEMKKWTARN